MLSSIESASVYTYGSDVSADVGASWKVLIFTGGFLLSPLLPDFYLMSLC